MLGPVDSKLRKKEGMLMETEPAMCSSSSHISEEIVDSVSTEDSSQEESEDEDYNQPNSKTKREDYITLKLPKRDTLQKLSPLAYRLKLSTRQQTAFVAGLIKVGGGELKDTTVCDINLQAKRQRT